MTIIDLIQFNSVATEGFLSSISNIPDVDDVKSRIASLEAFVDGTMAALSFNIAMESSGLDDDLSNLADKAKAAGEKMKEGKKKGDDNLIYQGSEELKEVMNDLGVEASNAKTPKDKSRLIQVLKIVGAILGAILLAFGAIKAGTKISDTYKQNKFDRLAYEKEFPDRKAAHPVLDDLWITFTDLCLLPPLKGFYHLCGSNMLD